ncbi:MAG: VCBS repeat-containing protein [Akkermansiaceae bacterium]
MFTEMEAGVSGVDFVNPIDKEHPTKRLYLGAFACGGVAIGDFDGDGISDVFLTSGPRKNRLYRGIGGMKFEDVTEAAGVAGGDEWTAGASLVDVDADGDLDIYVCNYDAPNALFINDGKGRFTEKAGEFGLAISDASLMASFCDYDLDGDLDCFLLTRDFKRAGGRPEKHPIVKTASGYELEEGAEKFYKLEEQAGGKWVYINAGREDFLLRNEGGKFVDVSKEAGISGRDRGNSSTWWDYDNDGLPDLYVGNDFKDADRLYRNNGDGTFKDVIASVAPHTPWFSMGADLGDLDGDGREDLLLADMAGTNHFRSKTTMGEIGSIRPFLVSAVPRQYMHNVLYLNQDSGLLVDGSFLAGLAKSDWSWAVKINDFDLDGLPDVYFTNGVSRSFNDSDVQRTMDDYIGKTEWDFYESREPRKETNLAFANRGGLSFENVSEAWGLAHFGMSYSAATGDLDGDGDVDLVVAGLDEPVKIYRNDATATRGRVVVRLVGAGGNPGGYGATVTLKAGGLEQVRTLRPATGFVSTNAPELCFGLGEADELESLTVKWQRGTVQRFSGLKSGQIYTISEPRSEPPKWQPKGPQRPMFVELRSPSLGAVVPKEQHYDDYARQPLLPYQHSLFGPGMAWADVDRDGDQDFYLSRPAGEAGQVYLTETPGNFASKAEKPFDAHAESEELAPLFFDADGDGSMDLFVVNGGVECEPGDAGLRDRLYLGKGDGTFVNAPEGALPDLRDSGSCVAEGDFDGDGDVDLFVGARVIPGRYPETPSSRLLRNDSKPGAPKFVEITATMPGLEKAGLVTGALWSDADGDGRVDLLLTCEWGPVRLFLNREGKLLEKEDTGILDRLGWWNGIAGADVDGDGDTDYVVTNQGLNTPYKASVLKPELLYYGEMDESGRPQIIEAKFEGKTLYPRRGFSCSSGAMPSLRGKLGTFKNFATSSLEDLYSETRLEKAQRFEANYLETSILINDGKGGFEMKPLPRWAQLSRSNCALLEDLDGDGKIDCLLGQNFYGPQPEIGHFDMGSSLLLKGKGDGTFEPVLPRVSGIQVPGAVMSVKSVDLNGDGQKELILGVNRGQMRVFSLLPK